jgi:medium-chain acyl-[acyl-carrier-protein] hydrolase
LPEVEVCAVQLPGRDRRLREPPYTNVTDLVEAAAEALVPLMQKPFALFGHSMGALISFELARFLRRHSHPLPSWLFVSGRRAPHIPDESPSLFDLPEAELIEELKKLNGTPKEVLENPELMQLVLPLLRADFSLCRTHEYLDEPPLDCPITALGGVDDQEVLPENVEAWRQHTKGSFYFRMLPGDHFFIHTSRESILRILSRDLVYLQTTMW